MRAPPHPRTGLRRGEAAAGRGRRTSALLAALVMSVVVGQPSSVQACGLEPVVNGGFQVSHPGSLQVAVAVAAARRESALPQAADDGAANDVLFRRMLADPRQLQARLRTGHRGIDVDPGSFSVVLVGPGLWSQFHTSRGGVLARYHTTGPLPGRVTVLKHHAVLQALLSGTLSVQTATQRGPLAYADGDSEAVRRLFESGFSSETRPAENIAQGSLQVGTAGPTR